MDLNPYFRSIVDLEPTPVVIIGIDRTILYMNEPAAKRYEKRGGRGLVGTSHLNCHMPASNDKITRILEWFQEDPSHNRVFITHKEKDNADTFLTAIRDENGSLIGYFEKFCPLTPTPREELFQLK